MGRVVEGRELTFTGMRGVPRIPAPTEVGGLMGLGRGRYLWLAEFTAVVKTLSYSGQLVERWRVACLGLALYDLEPRPEVLGSLLTQQPPPSQTGLPEQASGPLLSSNVATNGFLIFSMASSLVFPLTDAAGQTRTFGHPAAVLSWHDNHLSHSLSHSLIACFTTPLEPDTWQPVCLRSQS